jgi:hypothetical protein
MAARLFLLTVVMAPISVIGTLHIAWPRENMRAIRHTRPLRVVRFLCGLNIRPRGHKFAINRGLKAEGCLENCKCDTYPTVLRQALFRIFAIPPFGRIMDL